MLWMFLQTFSYTPIIGSEELILEYCVYKFSLSLPRQPIKFQGLDKNDMFIRGTFLYNF